MRSRAAVGAVLMASCASGDLRYASFNDVPYHFAGERTVWSSRASLEVRIAHLNPDPGTGRLPLVLLHPWGFNMTVWSDVAPVLAAERPVLLVDLPGHGKSDKAHTPMPMRRLAIAVLDAMDAAGVSKAYLGGNSLGGATSLAVAEVAPTRAAGLLLIAAPGGNPLPMALQRMARTLVTASELESASTTAWVWGLRIAERSDRPLARRLRDDLLALRSAVEYPAWCRAASTVLRSVATYAPVLERIKTPALVVHGEADLLIRRSLNESMAKRLPAAQLVTLEGCGHLPEVECPDQLVGPMQAFLRTLDQAEATAGR